MKLKQQIGCKSSQEVYINVIDIKKSEVIAKIRPFNIFKNGKNSEFKGK